MIRQLSKFFTFIAFFTLLMACGGQQKSQDEASHHHNMGKEYSSTYICPMHCEGSGSETAGTCPVCGMDYVLLEDHVKDGHTH